MNVYSSLLKNSDLCCDKKIKINKKLIWFRKIRSVFVRVKKKKVFGIEKSDLCLLNKIKSFCFKKYQICFLELKN